MLKVAAGEMNLNIPLAMQWQKRAHVLHMWEFAIQPPWSEAAGKIIELTNIWNHEDSKDNAARKCNSIDKHTGN